MRLCAPLACALALAGCGAAPPLDLSIRNDSTTWLRVGVWKPGGEGDFRPGRSVMVGPAGRATLRRDDLAPQPPVRLEIEAMGPEVRTSRAAWYELVTPGRHTLTAQGEGRVLALRASPAEGWTPLTPEAAAWLAAPDPQAQPPEAGWMEPMGPQAPSGPDNPSTEPPTRRPRSGI